MAPNEPWLRKATLGWSIQRACKSGASGSGGMVGEVRRKGVKGKRRAGRWDERRGCGKIRWGLGAREKEWGGWFSVAAGEALCGSGLKRRRHGKRRSSRKDGV